MPERFVTPVVMVAVYCVLGVRVAAGVKVRALPTAAYATIPATEVPPVFSVKFVELIVVGFIG